MNKTLILWVTCLSLVGLIACVGLIQRRMSPVPKQEMMAGDHLPSDQIERMRITRGGQLYDNWWQTTLDTKKPKDNHPLWKEQGKNQRDGYQTYRCKECHGWDYFGKKGAYGNNSHNTGFKGVLQFSHLKSPTEIEASLKGLTNTNHDYSRILGNEEIADLVLFLKKGLIDTTEMISKNGTFVGGSVEEGLVLYEKSCLRECHGRFGTIINFGTESKPEFLGTVADKNPWEFVHKLRFGQPGTKMPAAVMNQWSEDDIFNLLAFSQTLPHSNEESGFFRQMMTWVGSEHMGRGFGPSSE